MHDTPHSDSPTGPGLSVFISYSHADAVAARRLRRHLVAHGVVTWLDERELPVGTALTASIRRHIRAVDAVVVIASRAAAESSWVGKELSFAGDNEVSIVPFFVEQVTTHDRFADFLGVDALTPLAFATAADKLVRELYRSIDSAPPRPDRAALIAGLRDVAREERSLAPLIDGYLDSEGLHSENIDGVAAAPLLSLDEAVNAIYDMDPCDSSAMHAATLFARCGAGARALLSWIEETGDGKLALVAAVGEELDPALHHMAIELLDACRPTNYQALYNFLHKNDARLNDADRATVRRLVTWPVRTAPDGLGDVLGWVAWQRIPEAGEIREMWCRWIETGQFNGTKSPRDLARYLADAEQEDLPGREKLESAHVQFVYGRLCALDMQGVWDTVNHIMAAVDAGSPTLPLVLHLAESFPETARWRSWEDRDSAQAGQMKTFLLEICKEARGERDWLRALATAGLDRKS